MYKVKRKSLFCILLSSFLVALFLLMVVILPINRLSANADDEVMTEIDNVENTRNECEQIIAETRERYKNLKEYSYGDEFDAEMQKTGMTVGESLVEQICYYQQMLGTTTDEKEISKINALIYGTTNILDMYQNIATQSEIASDNYKNSLMKVGMSIQDYATIYALASSAVPAAIAWFNGANYLLSAELLTHAWIENFFPGDYYPINGNRVVGSQLTYDFVNSNETYQQVAYPIYDPNMFNTATCYEEDLGFALHGVNISRSNNEDTKITITDIYDFEVRENYNSVLAALIRVFEYAQGFGIIGNYNVVINVDVADALYLKLNYTTNNVHSVSVYNYSNKIIDVAYNTRMCAPAHAQTFNNLSDIDYISIPAKGYKIVNISTNALASHIAFCYIKDGYRIVTYADELYLDRNILNVTFAKKAVSANDIAIITKKGTEWLIYFTNTYNSRMRVDYNSKMCNESDAKTWTGLKDIKSFYLDSGKSEFKYISENYFATHIAARYVSTNYEYYIYADGLNANGSMTIGRRTEYIYNYLTISNNGKINGKWNIRIFNPLNTSITAYYNCKMCNYNDAKNWTGLNDIKSIYIPANSYREINISENWFATSITISYITNGYRLISYADGLSTNGTMNLYNNRIGV